MVTNISMNENILFKKYSPTFLKCILSTFQKPISFPPKKKKKEERNDRAKTIISQNIYPFRSSSTRLGAFFSLGSRDHPVMARGKIWMEGREQREDGEEHTHAQRDGCTCNSRLGLDIENSPLMTATRRNAGSLVLATWPGSSPLAPRVAPVSLFPSSVACSPVLSTVYNSSYLEHLIVNYHTGSNVDLSWIQKIVAFLRVWDEV